MPKQWTIDVRALSLTTIQFSRAWSCSPSTSQQSIERAHYSAEFESSEFNQKLKQNKTKRTKNNNLHKYIFEVSFVINYRAVYQAKKKYLANFDKIVAVWVRCSNAYRKRTPPKKKINQNAVFMLKEEEKKFMCASQNTFDFWELCFHSLKLRHDIYQQAIYQNFYFAINNQLIYLVSHLKKYNQLCILIILQFWAGN